MLRTEKIRQSVACATDDEEFWQESSLVQDANILETSGAATNPECLGKVPHAAENEGPARQRRSLQELDAG